MDPLTITATCITLVATVSRVSIQINGFVREVRDARSDLDAVSRELISLKTILEILSDDAKNSIGGGFPQSLVRQISGILANCRGVLEQIEASLQKHAGGGVKRGVKWSLSGRDDVNKLQSSLEAHKSALDIALDMVALTMAREIKADTEELRNDTAAIKDDTTQILLEIARLQARLPQDDRIREGAGFTLQRYLDNLSSYAETSCDLSNEESDSGIDVETHQTHESSLGVLSEEIRLEPHSRDESSSYSPTDGRTHKSSFGFEEYLGLKGQVMPEIVREKTSEPGFESLNGRTPSPLAPSIPTSHSSSDVHFEIFHPGNRKPASEGAMTSAGLSSIGKTPSLAHDVEKPGASDTSYGSPQWKSQSDSDPEMAGAEQIDTGKSICGPRAVSALAGLQRNMMGKSMTSPSPPTSAPEKTVLLYNSKTTRADAVDDAQLETTPPQWHTRSWFNETLVMEGFSFDVGHNTSTLDDMMAHDNKILISCTDLTIHKRSRPFAQGATRAVFYARTAASTNLLVLKSFKQGGKLPAHLIEEMRCQALCKAFALEFNALLGENYFIDFIVATRLRSKSGTALDDECMTLEPFLNGAQVKYNNNAGYVNKEHPNNPFKQMAQAFSHFTFSRSTGSLLVSNLQGVGYVLRDPAIHTLNPERFKLVDTNLNKDGFQYFFASHECNTICHKLVLKSNASMPTLDKYALGSWLSMGIFVCCCNKLCGKIMRLASAKKSDTFPGCYWCYMCWPQLQLSMVNYICVTPRPHHEFSVFEFFYESHGRIPPRKCPEHRKKKVTVSGTAVVASNHRDMPKIGEKVISFFSNGRYGGRRDPP